MNIEFNELSYRKRILPIDDNSLKETSDLDRAVADTVQADHKLTEAKKENPYDDSSIIELDWSIDPTDAKDYAAFNRMVAEIQNIIKLDGHKKNIQKHLAVIFISCIRVSRYAPKKYLAYSRDNNPDFAQKLYNPLKISMRKLKVIIDAMTANGLIESKIGVYFDHYSRLSRFRPTEKLLNLIAQQNLAHIKIIQIPPLNFVVMKDENKKVIRSPKAPGIFDLDPLDDYNDLILSTDIDLAKNVSGLTYLFDQKMSYRVFNGNSYKLGGRFYGGWWVNCKKVDRRYLLINGEPTTELDYKANHLWFLYGLNDLKMPDSLRDDPYAIGQNRTLIKAVFTIAMNAGSENQAWRAVFQKFRKNAELKDLVSTKAKYRQVLNSLLDHHPVVAKYVHSGFGLTLQNMDSNIASTVLSTMTERSIPCLCIHDSFLVTQGKEDVLEEAMKQAYFQVKKETSLPTIRKVRSLAEKVLTGQEYLPDIPMGEFSLTALNHDKIMDRSDL